eukprot:5752276-Pyramimonas_sp.AAC.1
MNIIPIVHAWYLVLCVWLRVPDATHMVLTALCDARGSACRESGAVYALPRACCNVRDAAYVLYDACCRELP